MVVKYEISLLGFSFPFFPSFFKIPYFFSAVAENKKMSKQFTDVYPATIVACGSAVEGFCNICRYIDDTGEIDQGLAAQRINSRDKLLF
mmetsp:Transcript_3712/g.4637  ORF Transcript_3712/g.4637 Transcript_3712/m.4637 type:complete len:89 (-) Transcript_3712:200-466(-)